MASFMQKPWPFSPTRAFSRADEGISKKYDDGHEELDIWNFWRRPSRQSTVPRQPSPRLDTLEPLSRETIFARSGSEKEYYVIHKVPDDAEVDAMSMAPWRRRCQTYLGTSSLLSTFLSLLNLKIQIVTILGGKYIHPLALGSNPYMIWLWIILQVFCNAIRCLRDVVMCFAAGKSWRPRLRLQGDNLPRVDVVITVCREPLDVVQDTVLGALHVDYPKNQLRILVSDDGDSRALRGWAGDLRLKHPNLYYTSRSKEERGGFKGGNLNHAIKMLQSLPGGRAEYMAGLDTDMIPEKRWLRALMPHLALDPKLGVVCPAQHFYNIPENDPLLQGQIVFWRCMDIFRDLTGSAWNTGSGWIARRQALDDIGGFSTDVIVEDVYSSIRMMAEGWKTAYIPEALQYGLMPETYAAHLKQFIRWNIGGCQMFSKMGYFLSPSKTKHLNLLQRLGGITNGLTCMVIPFIYTAELSTMGLLLASGVPSGFYQDMTELRTRIRLQCTISIFNWFVTMHLGVTTGYQAALRNDNCVYMQPYYAITVLRTLILPTWLGGTRPSFTATGSMSAPANERVTWGRPGPIRRIYHLLVRCGWWYHAAVIFAVVLGVGIRLGVTFRNTETGILDLAHRRDLWVGLLTTLAWPPPRWLLLILDMATPLFYMIDPPNMPDREDMMEESDENQVRYPRSELKRTKWTWSQFRLPTSYHIILAYTFVVLVVSFWI